MRHRYPILLFIPLLVVVVGLLFAPSCASGGSSKPSGSVPATGSQSPPPATPSAPSPTPPPPSPPPVVVPSGVNVTTMHFDNRRAGLNPSESTLTPANVNPTTFGKLFTYLLDGFLYAQPLYVSGLDIGGVHHNVVYVATERDSVYALDADRNLQLWQVSLLRDGETPQRGGSIAPFQGITSTPAIDVGSNTMYVVSAQHGAAGDTFRLHALDLTTGFEKLGGPALITASVPSSTSKTGITSLTGACVQRASLLLAYNSVFIGFSGCPKGWLLAYDAQSLAQTGRVNISPNIDEYGSYGGAGGVWMGGDGPVADDNGGVFISTGNGPYDPTRGSYGDSVLKFDARLNLQDHFTPGDWSFLWCNDSDLAAGGVMMIPGTTNLLAGGKTGKMYMLNTTNLGGMQPNDAGVVQSLSYAQGIVAAVPFGCVDNHGVRFASTVNKYQFYGTPAFFNGSVYAGVVPVPGIHLGALRQFSYSGGQLVPGAISKVPIAPHSYGTTPFISANGTQNGIVWMIDHGLPIEDPDGVGPTSAILRAYDATDVSKELYNSSINPSDRAGLGIKFSAPIVANGKVFIGAAHDSLSTANPRGELDVYGLK